MYKFYEKIETDNALMAVYKFTDEKENIFGVITTNEKSNEEAMNELMQFLNDNNI